MPAAAASASTEAEQLGRDLLDDTVKHVNNVSKLLALMGDGDEVRAERLSVHTHF